MNGPVIQWCELEIEVYVNGDVETIIAEKCCGTQKVVFQRPV